MMMLNTPPLELDEDATSAFAGLFHAVSDPTRLAILQHLASGEHRVRDLVDHMDLAQSTVSTHLACLRGFGLVRVRPEGRASWFSLAEPDRLADILVAARSMLEATGSHVSLHDHLMIPAHTMEGDH